MLCRRSMRLKGFDYSKRGNYFVTICVQNKINLFWTDTSVRPYDPYERRLYGENLNDIGLMIDFWWHEIPNHFKNVKLDEFVIMPDHIHGIIVIKNDMDIGADRCVGLLGNIIQWFKTMSTNEYIRNVKIKNWPRFNRRLFQRNYFEEIVRDKGGLERVRKYIRLNPTKLSQEEIIQSVAGVDVGID